VSVAVLYPHLVGEFVANLTHPGRDLDKLRTGSNDLCRWQCVRGHQWDVVIASRIRQASGCRRCGVTGRSLFELEVASLLRAATGLAVQVDALVAGTSRRDERVDLHLPALGWWIDLDPLRWHAHGQAKDARKAARMAAAGYASYRRVRPCSLGPLHGCTTDLAEDTADAWHWTKVLAVPLAEAGVELQDLTPQVQTLALRAAAATWRRLLGSPPTPSAVDAAPHLAREFVANLTHPGLGPAWLAPSSNDRCRWRCTDCGRQWDSAVFVRVRSDAGCRGCASRRRACRAVAPPGRALADLHPDLAALYQCNLTRPGYEPTQLPPTASDQCRWRCRRCQAPWKATVRDAVRADGTCPRCRRAARGRAYATADPARCLAVIHPDLAAEYQANLDHPGHGPTQLTPRSNDRCRWRCRACGYVWAAVVANRTGQAGTGCPRCGRKRHGQARATAAPGNALRDLFPQLATEFRSNITHPDRHPDTLKPGSHDYCWWQCGTCNRRWLAMVKKRTQGQGCPACRQASRRSR
jgi:hypothetical protein